MSVEYRPVNTNDQDWINQQVVEQWGADFVIAHGEVFYPSRLPGFIAIQGDHPAGLVTYNFAEDACEIITLHSLQPAQGIGTTLIELVIQMAHRAGCRRLWLITTNDNLPALRFYQKRGFHLVAVHPGAVNESRKLKPSIPEIGLDGIPLRDEFVLSMDL